MTTALRELQHYVENQYDAVVSGETGHGQAFVNISQKAELLANGDVGDAIDMMARVIVGDDITRPAGGGEFWAGPGPRGADGFAPAFVDDTAQIVHATAGLYVASNYSVAGTMAAYAREALTNYINGEIEYADYNLFSAAGWAVRDARRGNLGGAILQNIMDPRAVSLSSPEQLQSRPTPTRPRFSPPTPIPRPRELPFAGPRNRSPDPKAGEGTRGRANLLDPVDNPFFTPPKSARDLDGYRFGDVDIDQFSPRTVEVLDAIQRNAGVSGLQITGRVPGLISTDAVGELGPERGMNGETIRISVADLRTGQRLAVLEAAIRAGATGIDADDGTLTFEIGSEAAQGERVQGSRRAVADQNSWVYQSQVYQNYVAGANVFPENPVPRPSLTANERATVLPSTFPGRPSRLPDDFQYAPAPVHRAAAPSARSPDQFQYAATAAQRATVPAARSPDQFQYAPSSRQRAAAPATSVPSRSVSLRSPFSSMQGADERVPSGVRSAPQAPSPARLAEQYRMRAQEIALARAATRAVPNPARQAPSRANMVEHYRLRALKNAARNVAP